MRTEHCGGDSRPSAVRGAAPSRERARAGAHTLLTLFFVLLTTLAVVSVVRAADPTVSYVLGPDSPNQKVTLYWPDGAPLSVTLRVHEAKPSYVPDSVSPGAGASYEVSPWGGNPRTITFSHPAHPDDIVVQWAYVDDLELRRVWTLYELREVCGTYMAWDPELEDCVRTAEPLPPELELFAPLGRLLVRPPAGVIVLYPDGTWTEETGCPAEFVEETHVNNWRFCRDPERHDRIPRMWNPPINGIPFEEVEEIFAANKDTLMAIDGVSSIGLGVIGIYVRTFKPELVPTAVEGLPIFLLEPVFGTPLSHTESVPWRPLTAAARIGLPKAAFGQFEIGTLTAVALAAGEPWLILPAHLLRDLHGTPVCPVRNGKRLHECPKYHGMEDVEQPLGVFPNPITVGKVTRWDIIPYRSWTPPTLDVAAAFADTDTIATNGFLQVSGAIEGYGAWSGLEREPTQGETVTIVSSLSPASGGHVMQAKVELINLNFPFGCNPAERPPERPCNDPGKTFYTTERTMTLEISAGSRCLEHSDSGSPVLGSDKRIVGMLVGRYNRSGQCYGLAVSAPAIRQALDFDAWLGTATASGLKGHADHCRDHGPCGAGGGDCDSDAECQAGFV